MQNSAISTRITSLNGSLPSSVVFACKTATLGPELQVFIGPRPHLWICACKTAYLPPELIVSMGPRHHLWICANKTASLAPKSEVLWVPDLTCGFVQAKQRL